MEQTLRLVKVKPLEPKVGAVGKKEEAQLFMY